MIQWVTEKNHSSDLLAITLNKESLQKKRKRTRSKQSVNKQCITNMTNDCDIQ